MPTYQLLILVFICGIAAILQFAVIRSCRTPSEGLIFTGRTLIGVSYLMLTARFWYFLATGQNPGSHPILFFIIALGALGHIFILVDVLFSERVIE